MFPMLFIERIETREREQKIESWLHVRKLKILSEFMKSRLDSLGNQDKIR